MCAAGSFHVFALDFVVGADLQPRFLEANEAPAMCSHNREGEDCLDVPCAEWCAALCFDAGWFGLVVRAAALSVGLWLCCQTQAVLL